MCFGFSLNRKKRARAARRRYAYKVVRPVAVAMGAVLYAPLLSNKHLRYELGKTYEADAGPWDVLGVAAHGMYVCLTRTCARELSVQGSACVILVVEVEGFRHVAYDGTPMATYSKVRFIRPIELRQNV